MRDYKLSDDAGPAISFTGAELASVSSWGVGRPRWTELRVYRTQAGRIILHKTGISTLSGETVRQRVLIFHTFEAMVAHLGLNRLAHTLYRALGLEEVRVA